MSNRCFRFNLFKLNSYSSPHKNSSCSFPILSMPACVHLAHHDTSPSRPQPSSCSAIPDSSHSWATSSLSDKPAEKKKKEKPADYFENVSGIWSLLAPSSAVSQMVATSPLTGSLPPWLPELCPLYRM